MPRERRLPFVDGDRCSDGRGNIGSVRRCLNASTREYFLGIKIIEGPNKGAWGKSYDFTPEIDHEGGTSRQTCHRCDRPFLSRVRVLGDLGGYTVPRDLTCLTCTGLERGSARPDQEPESYLGSQAHKTEHHGRG